MPKLIVFNMCAVPLLSLPLGCIRNGYQTQVKEFCELSVSPESIIDITMGPIPTYWTNQTGTPFRRIVWQDYKSELLEWWNTQTKPFWFGTYIPEQFIFVKELFGDRCTSVNFTWADIGYKHLLANKVVNHIRLIDSGCIIKTNQDIEIERLPYYNRFRFYFSEFDSIGLVPSTNNAVSADYQIDVSAFFNKDAFISMLTDIAPDADSNSMINYYQHWRSTFDKYFLQRRIDPTSDYHIDA